MNFKNLPHYYSWGIKILLFAIPFLSFWISKSMYFPYITGRNFVFRILVEIGIVLWIGLIVLAKEYRPKMTSLFTAILVFVGVVGLADLLGVDPYHSFWSRFERMEGYLMILHLFAYFILLGAVFRNKKDWLMFFNFFLFAGVLVGSYGVFQILGIKEAIQGGDVRIDGTIGNPTYLAAYLFLINALALVLFFNAKQRGWKIIYGAVIAFNLFLTYFTASRGVTLALLFSVPLFLVLYLFFSRKNPEEIQYRKIAIGALLVIVLIPLIFFLVRNQKWVRNNEVLSRFAAISLNEKTTRSRLSIWGISWEGFKERPILGWGQENYLQVFSKYYNPSLYDQEPWFDRSHNIIFDWLINAGVIGLLSYLAIFAILLKSVWRLLISKAVPLKEGLILLVAPLGYFFQNLLVFDNFNIYVIFFTLLAYTNFLSQEPALASSAAVPTRPQRRRSIITIISSAAIAIPILYFINFKPMAQAKGIIDGLIATTAKTDPIGVTLKTFQKTMAYNTFGRTESNEQLGRVAKILLDNSDIPIEVKSMFIEYAISELEDYLRDFPNDIRVHLYAGDVYQTLNSNTNINTAAKAREHFKAALALSPKKQQILFALTNNYLSNNEAEKALELAQQAIDLDPSYLEAQANKAIVAIIAERNDLAQEALEDMNRVRLTSEREQNIIFSNYLGQMQRIARVFIRFSQFNNARKIYVHLNQLTPGDENIAKALEALEGK